MTNEVLIQKIKEALVSHISSSEGIIRNHLDIIQNNNKSRKKDFPSESQTPLSLIEISTKIISSVGSEINGLNRAIGLIDEVAAREGVGTANTEELDQEDL